MASTGPTGRGSGLVGAFGAQGADTELIDAKALDLPLLD
jgi:hypothetical protein